MSTGCSFRFVMRDHPPYEEGHSTLISNSPKHQSHERQKATSQVAVVSMVQQALQAAHGGKGKGRLSGSSHGRVSSQRSAGSIAQVLLQEHLCTSRQTPSCPSGAACLETISDRSFKKSHRAIAFPPSNNYRADKLLSELDLALSETRTGHQLPLRSRSALGSPGPPAKLLSLLSGFCWHCLHSNLDLDASLPRSLPRARPLPWGGLCL